MSAIEMHAATDVGIRRDHNEDFVRATPSHGVAVLADGMGGHNAGEVASNMAVDIITRRMKTQLENMPEAEIDMETGFARESILTRDAIIVANSAIFETSQQRAECSGMGTTVVVAVFYDDRVTVGHVGDSRMYRWRGNVITHVTEDHSLIQEQVRRGLLSADDARNSNIKNLVTRALGIEAEVQADIVEDIVQDGDIYLMCSDGLTDVVPDEAIRLTLSQYKNNLDKAAMQLIQLANDAGGPDNISVILTHTKRAYHRGGGFLSRVFSKVLGNKS
ncbi:MAG: Stp1/IreP family PP2C-type Ser/Thr phosphatase [Mariprofundales bacterium]